MNIASIDLGTNTVLLLIAKVDLIKKEFQPILNMYEIPRVGKGLIPGNQISQDRITLLFEVLNKYQELIVKYNCEKVLINATNALRIASNSQTIINDVKTKFGFDIKVIKGKDEARLSYLGAISNFKNNKYLVIDIGGGSTEIIYGNNNDIIFSESFPVGAVSLTEAFVKNDPPSQADMQHCEEKILEVFSPLKYQKFEKFSAIAVAGTPTSLASIKMGLKYYDEEKLDKAEINFNEIQNIFNNYFLKFDKLHLLDEYYEIVNGREDILPAGTLILLNLMKLLNFNELYVSVRGIRYGAVVDYLINE
jgi:exopolyphosphatase/guanosine-5'-triphosphate,3'-diphosphate pyrophosphatase